MVHQELVEHLVQVGHQELRVQQVHLDRVVHQELAVHQVLVVLQEQVE